MEKYIKSQKVDIIIMAVVNTGLLIILLIGLFSLSNNPQVVINYNVAMINLIIYAVMYIILGAMWYFCKKGSIASGILELIMAVFYIAKLNLIFIILAVIFIIDAVRYIKAVKTCNK